MADRFQKEISTAMRGENNASVDYQLLLIGLSMSFPTKNVPCVFSQISWQECYPSWALGPEGSPFLRLLPTWLASFRPRSLQQQMVRFQIKYPVCGGSYVWNKGLESIINILNTWLVIFVTRNRSHACDYRVASLIPFQGQRWGMCFKASWAADVQLLYPCQSVL